VFVCLIEVMVTKSQTFLSLAPEIALFQKKGDLIFGRVDWQNIKLYIISLIWIQQHPNELDSLCFVKVPYFLTNRAFLYVWAAWENRRAGCLDKKQTLHSAFQLKWQFFPGRQAKHSLITKKTKKLYLPEYFQWSTDIHL